MEKIYIVTKGDYSDYHIIACFADKDKAELCAKMYTGGWEEAKVEEYDIKDNDFVLNEKQCTFFAEVDITNLFENPRDSAYCTIKGPINADSIKDLDEYDKSPDEYVTLDRYREDDKVIIRIKKNYSYDRFTNDTAMKHFRKFLNDLVTEVKSHILDGADKNSLYYLIGDDAYDE